jgi:hypothetical protein
MPLYFFASFFTMPRATRFLELFVSTQAEHFFTATGRIAGAQIRVHHIEQLLELERALRGEHGCEFLRHEIWEPTGESGLLVNRHRAGKVTYILLPTLKKLVLGGN